MVAFTELPEFLQGRSAEERVARWLQDRGWYILPSYDYSGSDGNKAPRLQGLSDSWAVPDLDAAKDGIRLWVEVKSKAKANVFRKPHWGEPDTAEHGINFRNYLDYLEVEKITGTPVWIIVFEQDTRALLAAELSALGTPRKGRFRGTELANWPRSRFTEIYTFGE